MKDFILSLLVNFILLFCLYLFYAKGFEGGLNIFSAVTYFYPIVAILALVTLDKRKKLPRKSNPLKKWQRMILLSLTIAQLLALAWLGQWVLYLCVCFTVFVCLMDTQVEKTEEV